MAKTAGRGRALRPVVGLSQQERVLLDLLGEGLTNKQIAARMFLAEKTVKNYVSRLLAKLGMERRTQAAVSSPSSTARTAQATRLENVTDERPLRDTLSQLRLRELLTEVQDRVEQIVKGRDRLDGLVEAMLVVTSGLNSTPPCAPS